MLVVARPVCAVDPGVFASYPPFIDVQTTPSVFGHFHRKSSKRRRKLAEKTPEAILVDSCACPTNHDTLLSPWHHSCLFPREPVVTH
jgi:hypothetical protein